MDTDKVIQDKNIAGKVYPQVVFMQIIMTRFCIFMTNLRFD